jgi:4-hydroxy-4-methyl-2-oxoglutarate aldolase
MTHRIHASIERPDAALIARFRKVWVENVVHAVGERPWLIDPAIAPLGGRDFRICGPAVTVLPQGTDTLISIAAVAVAQPGDVIVVAADGRTDASCWGNGLTLSARNRGLEGAVVDGVVLDSSAILAGSTPVYARGANMRHAVGSKPGSVNVPVRLGGVEVAPGDLILGDRDGLLAIPRAMMPEILELAEERTARLTANKARLLPGVTLFDLRGGRAMIEATGVEWID